MASSVLPFCILVLSCLICQRVLANSLKRGVAVKAADFLCDDFDVLNTMAWWHDWRCGMNYYVENNICTEKILQHESSHTDMVWGYYEHTNYSCYSSSTTGVQGPNEPNHFKQSRLTPQEAADGWRNMEQEAGDKILISPSAARCSPKKCYWGNETQWFDEFFSICHDCHVDYLATHTYWCGVDKTMDHLEYLYNRYGKPIWLTEIACRQDNNNADRVYDFMEGILPRLEASPFVARYSWYMLRIKDNSSWVQTSASLMKPDSSELTPLGVLYRDYVYVP